MQLQPRTEERTAISILFSGTVLTQVMTSGYLYSLGFDNNIVLTKLLRQRSPSY